MFKFPSHKATPSAVKKYLTRGLSLSRGDNSMISCHLKSGLIRGMAFGDSDLIRLVYKQIPILPDLQYAVATLLSSVAQRSSLLKPQGVVEHDLSLVLFVSKQKHLDSFKKTNKQTNKQTNKTNKKKNNVEFRQIYKHEQKYNSD